LYFLKKKPNRSEKVGGLIQMFKVFFIAGLLWLAAARAGPDTIIPKAA